MGDLIYGGSSNDREGLYQLLRGYTALWDLTQKPANAASIDKFVSNGNDLLRGVAVEKFDPSGSVTILCDGGFTGGGDWTSIAQFDPHNWVIRQHESTGSAIPTFWSHRLMTDHRHYSKEKGQRATIVGDAESAMGWAWLNDVLWLVELGAKVKDDQLKFDDAGFLPYFTGLNKGSDSRAALALNLTKRGTPLTDSFRVGSAWHVIHISRSTPTTGTSTRAGRPNVQGQATLRGDVIFHADQSLADFKWGDKAAVGCNPYQGHFAISPKDRNPKPPRPDAIDDTQSDQPILKRLAEDGIVPVVRIRAQTDTSSSSAPPNAAPVATTGAVPKAATETGGLPPIGPSVPTGTGDMAMQPGTMEFDTGDFVGISRSAPLPGPILDQQYAVVSVPMGLDSAATGGTNYEMAVCYATQYNDPNSAMTWAELTSTVAAADLPTDGFAIQEFEIPASALTGKGGGMLFANVYQLSTSDGDQPLLVGNPTISYPTTATSTTGAGSTTVSCLPISTAPAGYP